MAHVLFRVDAGPRRGLGHLQRCLSLAAALIRRGAGVTVLAPALDDVRRRVDAAGCDLLPLGIDAADAGRAPDRDLVIDAARRRGCQTIVVDSYDIQDDYLAALRGAGAFVVAVDDLAAFSFSAQLVVNGAADAASLPYRSVAGSTTFLLGPQYALLSSAFADTIPRRASPDVRQVLVTIGGTDPHNMLPHVLRTIDGASSPFAITAVAGPFSALDEDLQTCAPRHAMTIVRAPGSLCELMLVADVAVSAAGQTLYELAAIGTPAVAVRLFDNQAANVRALAAAGTVIDAGGPEDSGFPDRLLSAFTALLEDGGRRAEMSIAGRRLVDGMGVERVADAMLVRG